MAKGIVRGRGTISTNTNTTLVTPAANETVYLLYLTITVETAGTTSRVVVTDAASGAVIARLATVTADAILNINYQSGLKNFNGNPLTLGNALVITTSGGAAATINYDFAAEVR